MQAWCRPLTEHFMVFPLFTFWHSLCILHYCVYFLNARTTSYTSYVGSLIDEYAYSMYFYTLNMFLIYNPPICCLPLLVAGVNFLKLGMKPRTRETDCLSHSPSLTTVSGRVL